MNGNANMNADNLSDQNITDWKTKLGLGGNSTYPRLSTLKIDAQTISNAIRKTVCSQTFIVDKPTSTIMGFLALAFNQLNTNLVDIEMIVDGEKIGTLTLDSSRPSGFITGIMGSKLLTKGSHFVQVDIVPQNTSIIMTLPSYNTREFKYLIF